MRKSLGVVLFALLPLIIQAEPSLAVFDGPILGVDIDAQSSTDSYQGSWRATDISWPPDGYNHYWYYLWEGAIGTGTVVYFGMYPFWPDPPIGFSENEVPIIIPGSSCDPPLEVGKRYYLEVKAMLYGEMPVATGSSDGVTIGSGGIDTTPPTVSLSLEPVQASTTFAVSWTGSDAESGIDSYTVETRTGTGRWTTWLSRTTRTSQLFTGTNGQEYSFRVTARDKAGNSATTEAARTVVNAVGASLAIAATPSTLGFASGETSRTITLNLAATGGSVTLSSIREARIYAGWGTEEAVPEGLEGTIAAGSSLPLARTVALDDLQRAKALGSDSEGSFTLRYTLFGQSSQGTPVSAAVTIPVTVSGAPPSSLTIQQASLELPPSPYYRGDVIEGARLLVTATGSGIIMGDILVDGSTSWSSAPSFVASVNGSSAIRIAGQIPTTDPGVHTVTARITVPESLTVQGTYAVSDQAAPFPPARLVLVPEVAELFDLKGAATVSSNPDQGYEEYVFSGTAKMRFLSLGGVEGADDLAVSGLVVRYAADDPGRPLIRGGTVAFDSAGRGLAPAVTFAAGLLQVTAVRFTGNPDAPTDHLVIDAGLSAGGPASGSLPAPMRDVLADGLKGLVVKSDGVQARTFSLAEAEGPSFDAFGVRFRIHDVDAASRALVLGREPAGGRWFVSLSGSIAWNEKSGAAVEARRLTSFRNLSLYSDGSLNASFAFEPPCEIVAGYLALTSFRIESENGRFGMKLGGELRDLPVPLDALGAVPFEIAVDEDGNAQGDLVPVHELAGAGRGRGLGGGDPTEWEFDLATVDLTYLAVHLAVARGCLDRDHSEVRLGADLYLELSNLDGSRPSDDQRRVSFGELDAGGAFTGGIVLSMTGDLAWNPPTNTAVLAGKKLGFHALTLFIDALGVAPSPFALVLTGGLQVDLDGVEGRVNFQNLELGLDGGLPNLGGAITGGSLRVMNALSISVGAIEWHPEPSTITFEADGTTGSGQDRAFAKTERTVVASSFFRLTGASVNLGSDGAALLSGRFQDLVVYETPEGGRSFVLQNASLSGFGVTLTADVDYRPTHLRVAGTAALPGDISATVVGKMGEKDGEPSLGVFVAVAGLDIVVGPGVRLEEVGGGIFINPDQQDIDLVKRLAGFSSRALLEQKVAERGPQLRPGSFGVMIVGGAAFAAADVIEARALVTITANYFNLDAEVDFADGLATGEAYLAVGWRPAFAEGAFNVRVDFLDIVSGAGCLEFYVYSDEVWGVLGSVNVALLGADLASGELFIGAPGFMLEARMRVGVDIGLVSGSITFDGLVWYHTAPPEDTFGAYASVEVRGEVLWGLLSASAKIEGALIAAPEFTIYAVGSVKFKICWVTVFKGSIWVTIGSGGIDGGKGRNEDYDSLIDEARRMAEQMNEAREALADALAAAELALYQLDQAQQQAAGLALVERSGWLGLATAIVFDALETRHWGAVIPDSLPPAIRDVWDLLLGTGQQSLVRSRNELAAMMSTINDGMAALERHHQAVVQNLASCQDLLVEPLPGIEDIGSAGNPFQGMNEATVSVRGTTRTVAVGFRLDEGAAARQRSDFASVRQGFAEYQDRFIEQAGIIDARLQELDRILFQTETNLSSLTSRYADLYAKMGDYLRRYLEFQDENAAFALDALTRMSRVSEPSTAPGASGVFVYGIAAIRQELQAKLATLPASERSTWNGERVSLINALLAIARAQGVDVAEYAPADDPDLLFLEAGTEVWYRIPRAGFEAQAELTPARRQAAIDSYRQSSEPFRTKWRSASTLIATVFDRKAALYGILYEIYDQLAHYGSGNIRIGGSGNAAGIGGMQLQGLAFREVSTAAQMTAHGVPLPEGSLEPPGLTTGPLAPAALSAAPASTAVSGSTWVPVTTYFAGKRGEIGPYLEIPTITGLEGSVASTSALAAQLTVGFSASHPKGIAEFAYRVEPQSGSWSATDSADAGAAAGASTSSTTMSSGVYGQVQPATAGLSADTTPIGGLQITMPWLAVGNRNQFKELLFPEPNPAQGLYVYLRVRGAGGTTIERRATIQLGYQDASTGAPFSSGLVKTDDTPPATPIVTLSRTLTAESEQLYARWGSSDPESGIQRYEYAIGTVGSADSASAQDQAEAELMPMTALEALGEAAGIAAGMPPGAMGTMAPVDVVPWTNAGGRTEANIRGLHLENGKLYAVSVRATNGAGLSSVGTSAAVLVDTTPPTPPQITQFAQVSADGHPNSAQFVFVPAADPESGIAAHSIAVGTSAPQAATAPQGSTAGTPAPPAGSADDLFPWTEVSSSTGIVVNIPADAQQPLYLTVRALNNAGLQSLASARLTFSFTGAAPPPAPAVQTVPAGFTADGSRVAIGWNDVVDPASGIARYEYGLGTSPTTADVVPWKTVRPREAPYLSTPGGAGQYIGGLSAMDEFGFVQAQQASGAGPSLDTAYVQEQTGLVLAPSAAYYALVRAVNGAGLAAIGAAEPLRVDKTPAQASASALPGSSYLPSLALRLNAADPESGVAAYRWQVWRGAEAVGNPWMQSGWTSPPGGAPLPTLEAIVDPAEALGTQVEGGRDYHIVLSVRNGAGSVTAVPGITLRASTIEVTPLRTPVRVKVLP